LPIADCRLPIADLELMTMKIELSDEVVNRICDDLVKLDGSLSMTPELGRLYAVLKGFDKAEPDYPAQAESLAEEQMSLVLPEQDWHKLEHAVNQLAWNPGSLAAEGVAAFNRAIAEACGYGKKEQPSKEGFEKQPKRYATVLPYGQQPHGYLPTGRLAWIENRLVQLYQSPHDCDSGIWVYVPKL
jgi:hypothetical protein